jgi:hypothetical protein
MTKVSTIQTDVGEFIYPIALAEYHHEGVIGKFRDEWDVEEAEAQDIFSEMKKFLFVAEYAQRQCIEFSIDEPLLMVDKMWHMFIMFTVDYERFCKRFFGKMLHHVPFCAANLTQKINLLSQQGITLNDYKRQRVEKQLRTINSTFGVETLKKWYVLYGNKYAPEKINALQRPAIHGDLVQIHQPIDVKSIEGMNDSELITLIARQISPSMWCGQKGCGMYCTCNSSRNAYT